MIDRRRAAALALYIALVPNFLSFAAADAATPQCFGKKATIVGSNGGERLKGTDKADVIVARGGRDIVVGAGGADRICGGEGADALRGGGGNDKIDGQTGNDHTEGGAGDDLLRDGSGMFQFFEPGEGDDQVTGVAGGLDFVSFLEASAGITVDLAAGTATGQGTDTLKNIQGVEGSDFNDSITGTDEANFIFAMAGDDSITAMGSPEGEVPIDFAFDFIGPGAGTDSVDGGGGFDVVDFSDAPASVDVDLKQQRVTGGADDSLTGIEGAVGSNFDDSLTGDNAANGFEGSGGNDSMDGGAGIDFLVYQGTQGDGVTVDLAAGTASGGAGNDTLVGFENLFGSLNADTLAGNDGPNRIFGDAGLDTISGRAGDDHLNGQGGADSLDGGDGTDTCVSGTSTTNCESEPAPIAPARRLGWARYSAS